MSDKRSRRPERPSVTAKVRRRIIEATQLFARGLSLCEVAEKLSVSPEALRDYRQTHPELYALAKAEADQFIVEMVRTQAGTDAVLANPDAYLAMADNADRWCNEHGKDLFPSKDSQVRLSDFYRDWYLPECMAPDVSDGYKDQFERALRRWRFATGDPPVVNIDNQLLRRYRDFLTACRGQEPGSKASPTTVRNGLIYIGRLLRKAGPPGLGNQDAADLVPKVPWVKLPRETPKVPTIVSVDQINAVYRQAAMMAIPSDPGIDPAAWWRALLVFAWNTGLRRRSIFALQWEWLDEPGQRFVLPPSAMKSARGAVVYCSAVVLDHLDAIRPADNSGPVFPWPYHLTHFGTAFHRLQYDAGIPRQNHFGLHAIRRTLATRLYEVNPGAAQLALGHTNDAVTREHYVRGPEIIARALDAMAQPEAFHTRRKTA